MGQSSLGVGADPVHDPILIKVMLMSEGEALALPELPYKDE